MDADKIIAEVFAINKCLVDKHKLSDNNIAALLKQQDLILQNAIPKPTESEPRNFKIELIDCGLNKIAVVKSIRTFTGKSLKESKDLSDVGGTLKEKMTSKEAESFKVDLEAAGAKVKIV